MGMTIEVECEEERKLVEMILREVRSMGSSWCITILREALVVKAWANGRRAGHFTMANVPRGWKEG